MAQRNRNTVRAASLHRFAEARVLRARILILLRVVRRAEMGKSTGDAKTRQRTCLADFPHGAGHIVQRVKAEARHTRFDFDVNLDGTRGKLYIAARVCERRAAQRDVGVGQLAYVAVGRGAEQQDGEQQPCLLPSCVTTLPT